MLAWATDRILPMDDKLSQQLRSLQIDRKKKDGFGRGKKWLIFLFLAVLVILIGSGAFFLGESSWPRLGAKPREVELSVVARRSESDKSIVLTAGGYIVPRHRVEVSSKISGRVEELFVDKGDVVRRGGLLARLDDREILAQLEQVRATQRAAEAKLNEYVTGSRPQEIKRAQGTLEEAKANRKTAATNLARARRLFQDGVVAEQVLDDAQNNHDVTRAQQKIAAENLELAQIGPRMEQIELARAELAQASANIRYFETQLDNTRIRAPIGGTILERLVEQGEMVTTGFVSGRGAKSALVSIADLGRLEVELDINESDIPRVVSNQPCVVSPDSYPDREYGAKVREIAPEADRQKATIQVKVAIESPDPYLRPETNAKVHFFDSGEGTQTHNGITIPKSALVKADGGVCVYLFRNGRAERRKISVANEWMGQVEVLSGLAGGEQVIVRGLDGIADGERVSILQR